MLWKWWGAHLSMGCSPAGQNCDSQAEAPCIPWPQLGDQGDPRLEAQETQVPTWGGIKVSFRGHRLLLWRPVLAMRVALHCYGRRETMLGAEEAVLEELVACYHCIWEKALCTDPAFSWPQWNSYGQYMGRVDKAGKIKVHRLTGSMMHGPELPALSWEDHWQEAQV